VACLVRMVVTGMPYVSRAWLRTASTEGEMKMGVEEQEKACMALAGAWRGDMAFSEMPACGKLTAEAVRRAGEDVSCCRSSSGSDGIAWKTRLRLSRRISAWRRRGYGGGKAGGREVVAWHRALLLKLPEKRAEAGGRMRCLRW